MSGHPNTKNLAKGNAAVAARDPQTPETRGGQRGTENASPSQPENCLAAAPGGPGQGSTHRRALPPLDEKPTTTREF